MNLNSTWIDPEGDYVFTIVCEGVPVELIVSGDKIAALMHLFDGSDYTWISSYDAVVAVKKSHISLMRVEEYSEDADNI